MLFDCCSSSVRVWAKQSLAVTRVHTPVSRHLLGALIYFRLARLCSLCSFHLVDRELVGGVCLGELKRDKNVILAWISITTEVRPQSGRLEYLSLTRDPFLSSTHTIHSTTHNTSAYHCFMSPTPYTCYILLRTVPPVIPPQTPPKCSRLKNTKYPAQRTYNKISRE